jgi:hypothetical protein
MNREEEQTSVSWATVREHFEDMFKIMSSVCIIIEWASTKFDDSLAE